MTSRTIHIVFVPSQSTYSFIMLLRRFVGNWGNVKIIRSGNGSNLSMKLICTFQGMDHIKISIQIKKHQDQEFGEIDGMEKKKLPTSKQHGRSLGTTDLECKSNLKLFTEDSWQQFIGWVLANSTFWDQGRFKVMSIDSRCNE